MSCPSFFALESFTIVLLHMVYMGVVHTHGGKNTKGLLFICLYGNICGNNFLHIQKKDGVSGWVYTTRDRDETASSLFASAGSICSECFSWWIRSDVFFFVVAFLAFLWTLPCSSASSSCRAHENRKALDGRFLFFFSCGFEQ